MLPSEFEMIVEKRLSHCVGVLCNKGKEYTKNKDSFHTFKVAGRMRNTTAIKALDGMKVKHDVSILDIVEAMENDLTYVPDIKLVNEKITDEINYHLLIEGMIEERRRFLNGELKK